MKIAHLIAGAGPMYCGSCMHGNTLAAALRQAGADVVLAPVYTPLRTDEENVSIDRLAMGGINVYLDEGLPFWRWMPRFLRRQLDRPALVSWVARRGSSTRPEQLGRLAVAMFRGEDGPLKGDVQGLVEWLQSEVRPDVVHLSNVMLAGLAGPLRRRLGVPVVATLSGEDTFLERLPAPYHDQARMALRACAAELSGLVAMSACYADFMADYLSIPREKIDVIRPGLNLEGFGDLAVPGRRDARTTLKTIGFLSRICPDKGLHLLVEAMEAMSAVDGLPPFRLRVAGYLDGADRGYLNAIRNRASAWKAADRFEYLGELDRSAKVTFLRSTDVFCLPSLIRESKGLPALEAWAAGVPVVLPDHGVFSELVADTGGGLLYNPQSAKSLAEALGRMLSNDALSSDCGHHGRRAVYQRYTADRESREMLVMYDRLCGRSSHSRGME